MGSRTVFPYNIVDNPASPTVGCTSKNYSPKTPNRTPPVAPFFFMPLPPNYPAPPFHLLSSSYSSSTPSQQYHLLPTLSRHSTPRLMSNRTNDMICVSSERWRCKQELAEENRKQDAQRLSNATKAKHEIVHPCLQDDKPPTVQILIDIFVAFIPKIFRSRLADLTVLTVLFVRPSSFIPTLLVDVMW